jgi:DNA-binding FrmR family transcriptional regulator
MVYTQTDQLSAGSLPDDVLDDVHKRLARIEGQVRGVRRLLDEGAGCKDVLHQVAAVNAAFDRVGYKLVASAMEHCVANPDSPMTTEELEGLFLKLS